VFAHNPSTFSNKPVRATARLVIPSL